MGFKILPACFGDAWNQSEKRQFSKAKTGHFEFLIYAPWPTGELTTRSKPYCRSIPGHFIEGNSCIVPFFFRKREIDGSFSQLCSFFPILSYEDFSFLLSFNNRFLCHNLFFPCWSFLTLFSCWIFSVDNIDPSLPTNNNISLGGNRFYRCSHFHE
jgi:hypothetical protein